jgi:hypothetical protein
MRLPAIFLGAAAAMVVGGQALAETPLKMHVGGRLHLAWEMT